MAGLDDPAIQGQRLELWMGGSEAAHGESELILPGPDLAEHRDGARLFHA